MIYDLMPRWLRWLLRMETATLPTNKWTWRHYCRYGYNPAKLWKSVDEYERGISKRAQWEIEHGLRPGRVPWLKLEEFLPAILLLFLILKWYAH